MGERAEAVIFDLDGVLVDSEPAHRAAARRLVEPHALTDEEYARYVGATLECFVTRLRDLYGFEQTSEQLAARYDELVTDELLARRLPPLDGARELLAAIRARGCRLALASQSLPRWVEASLAGAALDGEFELVAAADAVTRGKPAPDLYLHVAALLGVPPARCIAIEDSIPGVQSASAAGMAVVQSRQATTAPPPQHGAHAVIALLRDFDLRWLEDLALLLS